MQTLKQIRTAKGVTKAAIVRHLGISKPTYDEYERHPERMRIETAMALSEFLGVPIEDIFFIGDCK